MDNTFKAINGDYMELTDDDRLISLRLYRKKLLMENDAWKRIINVRKMCEDAINKYETECFYSDLIRKEEMKRDREKKKAEYLAKRLMNIQNIHLHV